MKKILSAAIALILLLLTVVPAFAETGTANDYPVIVIGGRVKSTPIYSADGVQVNDTAVDTDFIVNAVKDCLPYLGRGILTGNYQPWIDKVMEFYAPIYADMIPDKNGEITDGSRPELLSGEGYINSGYYGFNDHFLYDWREDPYVTADALYRDIQLLKQKTGKEKVSIVGRCYGANVMTAYLDKYGIGDIDTLVYSVSAARGADAASSGFAGKFRLDGKYLELYTAGNELFGEPAIDELLNATLDYVDEFFGFNGMMGGLEFFVEKLFPIIAPTVLRASFGSYCSFWAMVSDPYYEEAKKLVFAGVEDEYAEFIEKIDRYHKIQRELPEVLERYREEGLNVAVITKYNSLLAPVIEQVNLQSDDTISLPTASFGATSADFGEMLSEDYVSTRDPAYISSDHIIDASTCLFPERTWFIKDVPHSLITPAIARLILDICHGGSEYTVDTGEYGRFLELDDINDVLVPLDDEPIKTKRNIFGRISDFFEKMVRFWRLLFRMFRSMFDKNPIVRF